MSANFPPLSTFEDLDALGNCPHDYIQHYKRERQIVISQSAKDNNHELRIKA